MNGDQMKLPQVDRSAITSAVYLQQEWSIDPAPWVVQRLPDDLIFKIYKLKAQGIAEVFELERSQLAVKVRVYKEIAEVLPG